MKGLLSKKFITSMIVTVILLIVFFAMLRKDLVDGMVFGIWLAALLANFGIYTEGNIRAKHFQPPQGGS